MAYPDNRWCLGRPGSHEPSGNTALGWAEIPATCCARFACKDRKNSGIHPTLLTFGNDASVPKATGLEGHEGRGRCVFDWEDQFEVHRRFHGSDDLIDPFFSLRTYWGRPGRCQPRRGRVSSILLACSVTGTVPKSINNRQKRAHVSSVASYVLEAEPGLLGPLCRPQLACAPLALRLIVGIGWIEVPRQIAEICALRPNCFSICLAHGLLVAFLRSCPVSCLEAIMSNHAREDSMMAASVGRGSVPADPQSRLKNRWCDRITAPFIC